MTAAAAGNNMPVVAATSVAPNKARVHKKRNNEPIWEDEEQDDQCEVDFDNTKAQKEEQVEC